MTFRHVMVGATAAATLAGGAQGVAAAPAHQPAKRHHRPHAHKTAAPTLEQRYERHYREVKRLGGAPGRDIVNHGVRRNGRDLPATAGDIRGSLTILLRMEQDLRGGPASAPASATTPSAAPTSSTTSSTTASSATRSTATSSASASTASAGGGTSLPACTWQPESGGDYNAVNSSSGARGKYQLMPSTYYSYGGDGSWSPADQDRVAQRVYAATGGSAWVNC